MNLQEGFEIFSDPPLEFGPMPFWFLNDDLEKEVLIRQVRAFHEAGFGGIVPSARVGLSHRVGYLTDEYFGLFRRIVEEAARLGMKVILYDEGSYPSGSAQGRVVAENPDFASQAIGLWEKRVEGPFTGYWRPNTGRALLDRHVCTVVGRVRDGERIDPDSVRLLEVLPRDIVRIEVPEGDWKIMSVWNTHSGGHIRGVFPEEESGTVTAPPAGDILNPEAVACFLRLTHDRYYEHLSDFFGTTIIALFTDEPGVFGKTPLRPPQARPFTPGLADWLQERWGQDPRPWLPALWLDYGEGTEAFRQRYETAIQERMHEVFYAAQSRWCVEHGIQLTGHPAASNEMSAERYFQLPGQDMVWRYVEPDKPTAIEGAHSVAAKAATSAARIQSARRILTEVCGAYGWRLTLEEVKWLLDWHLVRGNNLINPHAVFYSIRDRRAWESEPDLLLHNVWRDHFPALNRYAQRLSWMLTDGEQVCQVAILGDGNNLPWAGAKQLYQNQIDFLYLDDQAVAEAAVGDGARAVGEPGVADGGLQVGAQAFRVVIVEGDPVLGEQTRADLDHFARTGGHVLRFEEGTDLPGQLDTLIGRDLRLEPAHPDLRFIHYRKAGLDFYLLVNEGKDTIEGRVWLSASGEVACWDPLAGEQCAVVAASKDGGTSVGLRLGRRESVVLVIDPGAGFAPSEAPAFRDGLHPLRLDWELCDGEGVAVDGPAPGDWAQHPGLELFSGTLCYRADLDMPSEAEEAWIDLGQVGDIAEVRLDGASRGVRMWPPYRMRLGRGLPPGLHQLEVRVTNTMANAYEGAQCPSGLMGPVRLILGPAS